MRPPILYLTVAFAAGLCAALNGGELWVTAGCVLLGAFLVQRRAPVGAAFGVMLVAGALWGAAAIRERRVTCAGQWGGAGGAEQGRVNTTTHAVVVRLTDPASDSGGVVEGTAQHGPCGGPLTVRWPHGHPAHGGTAWIVAALDEVPLFVFNGDLMWCEYETVILPDKMCGQTFLVKSRLDLNIFQYIRSSLDILNPAGDGQMCLQ